MDRLVLGLVPSNRLQARDLRTRAFTRALDDRTGLLIVERNVSSYDELAVEMTLGRIDVAWLPPILYARLERDDVASALVTIRRQTPKYCSALVAARGSRITTLGDLTNARVAWVDPLSAAGYVVARLGLSAAGVDPCNVFVHELFAGSHAEAVRAVLEGNVDVAATFVHLDPEGRPLHGAWTELGKNIDDVQLVAILGEVPPDLIATHLSVSPEIRERLATALLELSADPEGRELLDAVFGARDLERGTSVSYVALRDLLERASQAGIAGASEGYLSTAPPGST